MRTPKRYVATDGSVSYRVRHRENGRDTSTTFRGPDAENQAREFAEFLWVVREAQVGEAIAAGGARRPPKPKPKPSESPVCPVLPSQPAATYRLLPVTRTFELERIRLACVEEGLIDQDDLLTLGDCRLFTA